MLKKMIKLPLLLTFFGVVSFGIIGIGYTLKPLFVKKPRLLDYQGGYFIYTLVGHLDAEFLSCSPN
jgi:hypothetical protein